IDNALKVFSERVTRDVAFGCNLGQYGNFADELLYFCVTIEGLPAPGLPEIAPSDDVETSLEEPFHGPVFFGCALDLKPAEHTAQRRGHFLKPLLNPPIKSSREE